MRVEAAKEILNGAIFFQFVTNLSNFVFVSAYKRIADVILTDRE